MRTGAKALLALAGVAAIGAGAVLAADGGDGDADRAPSAAAETVAKMSTSELIGQRLVSGYVGTTPPKKVLTAVRSGRVGGVILFTNNMPKPATARRAIAELQRAASAGGQPKLFVMIDQEGGIVKRLPQLPPTKTPAQIGRSSDPARTARAQGRATGRALAKNGFNVNLAPVVDVPKVRDSFLGNRAFSRAAKRVATAGCAFAEGLEAAGTGATFKHFPGLGRAGANTDLDDVVIRAGRAALEDDWEPYRACHEIPSFVMVSSARYPSVDIRAPASLDATTYELLSGTGFKGLTITDALETPQFDRYPNAGRQAVVAGADVLLYGQAWSRTMKTRSRLIADVRAGRVARNDLEAAATRILELKNTFR